MDTDCRKLLIHLVALLLLGALVFALVHYHHEPSYGGKTLGEWVKSQRGSPLSKTETAAIRALGSNAIPYLLEWIQYAPPTWQIKADTYCTRFMGYGPFKQKIFNANAFAINASESLGLLGSNVYSSIPKLSRLMLMNKRNDRDLVPALASIVLARIAVPVPDYLVAGLGTNAPAVLPDLIQFLKDEQAYSHKWGHGFNIGSGSLGKKRYEPTIIIPALTNMLVDSNPLRRAHVIDDLGAYGPEARSAIPFLKAMVSDPSCVLPEHVTKALHKIAPEAWTNAPASWVWGVQPHSCFP